MQYPLGLRSGGAAGAGGLRTERASPLPAYEHGAHEAPLWQTGPTKARRPARPGGLPDRRGLGLLAGDPPSSGRPAQLFHPRHQRTRRGPPATARGVTRVQRARAVGTWVPLCERPAVFGRLAVSEKARAYDGAVDGDDRVVVGLRAR